ncbi:MAG: hypothetical protein HOP14_09760 [Acidobacteria bacterium]|nr:hypothetical protein [Acidobacteriota bacterium]
MLAITVLGLLAPNLAAALTLRLESGGAVVVVQDNGPGDTLPAAGDVGYVGPLGGYELNVIVGNSKPAIGGPANAQLHLNVVSRNVGAAATIQIQLTDTDFVGPINGTGVLVSRVSGLSGVPATLSFQSFVDASNTAFGTAGPQVCTTGLQQANGLSFESTETTTCDLQGPFSMTVVAEATLANGQFGFDYEATTELPSCGTIGDFVWFDANRNGVQDPGESGINGVKVNLKDGGNIVASYVTGPHPIGGAPGYYQFEGACAGNYTVEIDPTTVPAGYVPTLRDVGADDVDNDSDGGPVLVSLPFDGASDQTIDFGFISPCTGSIGDYVWNDLNRNGIQEPGEPGIPGVTVRLVEGNQTTVTGPDGFYEFTGLCAGLYTVEVVDPPVGMVPTLQNAGAADVDSNGSPTSTVLTLDDSTDITLDFGFYAPCRGTIGNFVWNDLNRNGVQDPGEPGIQGVTLHLLDSTGATVGTAITDADGFYLFSGLCDDRFQVVVDPASVPPMLEPSPTGTTSPDLDSNASPSFVLLPLNGDDLTIDFGFMPPCAGEIGNFVWNDLNANGRQDAGEPGIAGVAVELRRASDNGLLAVTTTDDLGGYRFQGLCGGDYKVVVTPPAGYDPTTSNVGGAELDSNPNPALVSLPNDFASDLTIDFGFVQPAALGDFVWLDLDADGVQDGNEPGLEGFSVTLLDCTGMPVASTLTGPGGFYLFSGLRPGCYKVAFGSPGGYLPSPANQGGDDALDSDSVGGMTGQYTLVAGETNLTVDAGFYVPAALGDFVWKDLDADGQQDGGEPGIAGVLVTLYSCATGTPLATDTTDGLGAYLFSGLTPGCYYVSFETPAGLDPSPANQGNDATDSDAVNGVSGNYLLMAGETNRTVDAGFVAAPPPICVPLTFDFTKYGNSKLYGPYGNVRNYVNNGVGLNVSAWSRNTSTNAFAPAFLGQYSYGLGVTNASEGTGGNNMHLVDNSGSNDYVMFEFERSVVVNSAFLNYVVGDSDVTFWVGTLPNAYTNHVTLSAQVLSDMGFTEMNTGGSSARTASVNAAGVSGNVVVIAAKIGDSNDGFKLSKITTVCEPSVCAAEGTLSFTGNSSTSGSAGNLRSFSMNGVNVKASAFSRKDSYGTWNTAYLGAYSGGLGVTDGSEGNGSYDKHKVDNMGGRDNYVLLEFDQEVVLDKVFLDAVGADSDITVWIGTKANPYANHLTLSDAVLASLTKEDNATANVTSGSRWADLNAGKLKGNVIVIAAQEGDTTPEDAFKLSKLALKCP